MNENKQQKQPLMPLKEFVNTYSTFYDNDIKMILAWSVYSNNQPTLIAAIADLAAIMQTQFMQDKRKHWEWSYYAFQNIIPEITEKSTSTECLNTMRMAFMAYENDPKMFVKVADDIMKNENITWEGLEALHPEIKELYEEGKK